MARETQKAKIERLETLLSSANETIERQNKQIDSMIDKADASFENSVTYRQMKKQIEDLELKLKVANESIEHNRKMYENECKTNEKLFLEKQKIHKLIDEKEDFYEAQLGMTENQLLDWQGQVNHYEDEIKELKKEIEQLKREQYKYETKKKLHKEIETLKKSNEEDLKEAYNQVAILELQIESKDREHNRRIKELEKYYTYKLNNQKKHNERGAGRKAKLTEAEISMIQMYRLQGKKLKEIADMFQCSVGLIHKLINKK